MNRPIRPLLAVSLLAWSCCAQAAAPPPAPSLADALPPGAVARLGSLRWRLLAEPTNIVASPDGKLLAVTTRDGAVELPNARTGQRRLILGAWGFKQRNTRGVPAVFSRNGKRMAACIARDWYETALSIRGGAGQPEERWLAYQKQGRGEPKLPAEAKRASGRWARWGEYVSAMALSPDGKVLAAGVRYFVSAEWGEAGKRLGSLEVEENVVRLWEVSSGKLLRELAGHKKEIKAVLFSPDGRTLTTVGGDGSIRFWDAGAGREKLRRREAGVPLFCADSSPGGKLLAAGSRECVLVWETATGKLRHRLVLPAPEVRSVGFSPDGKLLAGAGGRSIRLWRTDTGKVVRDASPVEHPVTAVAFSADGRRLFSAHRGEQVVRCWDVATLKPAVDLNGHAALVCALGFTPDGKRVVTSTRERDFRLWDISGGKPSPRTGEDPRLLERWWLASLGRTWPLLCENGSEIGPGLLVTPTISKDEPLPVVFTCSADGKRLLALKTQRGKKPALVVSDSRTNKVLREFSWEEGDSVEAALSPDGRTVAAAGKAVVCFMDVASGKHRRYDLGPRKHGEPFRPVFVKFSPDGSRVVVVGHGHPVTLRVVSARDGRLLGEIEETVWDMMDSLIDVGFSPDGQTLAVGKFFGCLFVWEVSTGQLIRRHRGYRFLFSPDNRRVAVLRGKALRLHDLYSGELLREYRAANGFLEDFTFSPDGRLLAASCQDTTVLIWDTASPERARERPPLEEKSLGRLWNGLKERASGGPGVEGWRKEAGVSWPDLAKGKSAGAYEAIGKLSADPERSIPFLKKRLHVPPADPARLRRLISDLDHEEFARREAASRELSKLGVPAGLALRAALAGKPSLEAYRRVERLLREVEREEEPLAPRSVRAVQVLERIGTKDAQELLKTLAEGHGGAPAARAAAEALKRLKAKPGVGTRAEQAKALAAIEKLGGQVRTEGGVVVGVDLSDTPTTDDDLKLLAAFKSLRTLTLFNTKVTGPGLAHLKGLDRLEELDLSWPLWGYSNAVGDCYQPRPLDEKALGHLKDLPALRSLNLDYTRVGESGLKHLGRLKNLRDLDLGHVKVTDKGLRHLESLARLEHLRLRYAPVTDRGTESLARLGALRELHLVGTEVGDEGLRSIGKLKRLEELDLTHTRVTDAGLP